MFMDGLMHLERGLECVVRCGWCCSRSEGWIAVLIEVAQIAKTLTSSRTPQNGKQQNPTSTFPAVFRESIPSNQATMANALNAVYRWAIPVAVGYSFVQASIYDVRGGTRAVIFDRLQGVKEEIVNEGTHFLVPWLQKSIIFDVRTRPRNISTTTGSKDLQMVSLTLRVLHRPEVKMLPKIYQVCLPFEYP